MKIKAFFITIAVVTLVLCAVTPARALEYDLSGIYNSLSDEARGSLLSIGAGSADPNTLQSLTPESIFGQIGTVASQQAAQPLRALIHITAVLLIGAMLSACHSSLSAETGDLLNTAAALCISAAVAAPAVGVIEQAQNVILAASNLMLAYVPVMAVLLAAGGSVAGSGSYYASVLLTGEGVAQLCSRVIVPFLNMFLGLSIVSGVTPQVRLGGVTAMVSRIFKWLLGFAMAVFSAVIGAKQLLSNAIDSASGRAVRFAVSSFVPVVGGALADAYKTVQGSIGLLKSGVGVFVILAVAFTFLPALLQCMLWAVALHVGRLSAEVLHLPQAGRLLEGLAAVFSVLIALLLCVTAIFIIATAVVLLTGGGAA